MIKRIIKILIFIISSYSFLFCQNTNPQGEIEKINLTAAKGNRIDIPFTITNATTPLAKKEDMSVKPMDNRPSDKAWIEQDELTSETDGANKTKQDYVYSFVPTDTGKFEVKIIGRDAKRMNDKTGQGIGIATLDVKIPELSVRFTPTLYERESKTYNFEIKGFPIIDYYSIQVKSQKIDTSINKTTRVKIDASKTVVGEVIVITVKYKGKLVTYFDKTGQKQSIFNLSIKQWEPQIQFIEDDGASVKFDEGIKFKAKKAGSDFESNNAEIIDDVSSFFDFSITKEEDEGFIIKNDLKLLNINDGTWLIKIDKNLKVPKDGLRVKVKGKLTGQETVVDERVYTLVNKL